MHADTVISFFFFNDTATTEIYTLSLHDALPIYPARRAEAGALQGRWPGTLYRCHRSEEHTSELQSRVDISYAAFCLKKTQESCVVGSAWRSCCHHTLTRSPLEIQPVIGLARFNKQGAALVVPTLPPPSPFPS